MLTYSLNLYTLNRIEASALQSFRLYSQDTTWRSKQDGESKIIRKYQLIKWRNPRKSKYKNRKSSKTYVTNVRETRNTRGKIMVKKVYPVYKDDAKHRPQRNDNRPRNIAKLKRRSGTPNQRYIYMGIGRVSDNGNDKNR